jgi:hypothetical protein
MEASPRGGRRAVTADLRPPLASHALAAGVSVFELARIMGTSVQMIERHDGRLLQGSGDAIRGKLDAYIGGLGQESAAASGQPIND